MERYCLTWNDFQSKVTDSFKKLKDENDFFDVTLVTEDDRFVSAHKVVLSASSEFFKKILRKADHSKPLIYLNGVKFKELSKVIDYIYEGETNIFQDDLESFLLSAKKMKIDGLIGETKNSDNQTNNIDVDYVKLESKNDTDIAYDQSHESEKAKAIQRMEPGVNEAARKAVKDYNKMGNANGQSHGSGIAKAIQCLEPEVYEEARKAVDEIVMKNGAVWVCKICNKWDIKASQIRTHAETHIPGLSFPCNTCGGSFRTRKLLSNHKTRQRCAKVIMY